MSAIAVAREVRESKTSSMCQVLTRKIKCCYSIFVRIRNFSVTRKQMHCISSDDTANMQLAVLKVCAVFRHVCKLVESDY
jgi:hypothetical protein